MKVEVYFPGYVVYDENKIYRISLTSKISQAKKMKTILIFSCLLFLGMTTPEGEVQLKYQFKPNDQFSWVQFKKQSVKQTIMGMEHEMHNNMHGEYLLKVLEVTSGSARIEAQFMKLKTTSKSIVGNMILDSEGAPELTETKLVRTVIGKPFYVTIDETGDVRKIEDAKNVTAGLGDVPVEGQTQEIMVSVLKQFLSEPALKANFKEIFIEYPATPLKLGDKWKTHHQPGMSFPIMLENTWSISEILPANINLAGDGVITTTDKEALMEFAGIKVKSDLSGKQTVKTVVNLKTGWPSKQDATAELKGTMKFAAGGMVPADMDVPVQVFYKSTHVIKRKAN
jgi:hypothetical protein